MTKYVNITNRTDGFPGDGYGYFHTNGSTLHNFNLTRLNELNPALNFFKGSSCCVNRLCLPIWSFTRIASEMEQCELGQPSNSNTNSTSYRMCLFKLKFTLIKNKKETRRKHLLFKRERERCERSPRVDRPFYIWTFARSFLNGNDKQSFKWEFKRFLGAIDLVWALHQLSDIFLSFFLSCFFLSTTSAIASVLLLLMLKLSLMADETPKQTTIKIQMESLKALARLFFSWISLFASWCVGAQCWLYGWNLADDLLVKVKVGKI